MSVARRPGADIERLVHDNVEGIARRASDADLGLAPDASIILLSGAAPEKVDDPCARGSVSLAWYHCLRVQADHELQSIAVVVDDARGFAWFQAPFAVTVEADVPRPGTHPLQGSARIGGLAMEDHGTWTIVAAIYSRPLPDAELLDPDNGRDNDQAAPSPAHAPTLSGDPKLAAAAARWFTTGLARHAAKDQTKLLASGTAPAELAEASSAATLARTWDRQHLHATSIEARTFAHGTIGWIRADLLRSRPGHQGAVHLVLGAIAIPEGNDWRWVSLQLHR